MHKGLIHHTKSALHRQLSGRKGCPVAAWQLGFAAVYLCGSPHAKHEGRAEQRAPTHRLPDAQCSSPTASICNISSVARQRAQSHSHTMPLRNGTCAAWAQHTRLSSRWRMLATSPFYNHWLSTFPTWQSNGHAEVTG